MPGLRLRIWWIPVLLLAVSACDEDPVDQAGSERLSEGRTHTVLIRTEDFGLLLEHDVVSVVSSNNGTVGIGHDHVIRLTCP